MAIREFDAALRERARSIEVPRLEGSLRLGRQIARGIVGPRRLGFLRGHLLPIASLGHEVSGNVTLCAGKVNAAGQRAREIRRSQASRLRSFERA